MIPIALRERPPLVGASASSGADAAHQLEDFMEKAIKRPFRVTPGAKARRARQETGKTNTKAKLARKGASSEPRKQGVLTSLIAMLRRPQGASLEQMCKATNWQAHSVRGAISGAIKKKLGLAVSSDTTNGVRIYRVQD
jgi:hypothetical protein